ncbi:uncharacterized protein PS065_020765 [Dugong dugon]
MPSGLACLCQIPVLRPLKDASRCAGLAGSPTLVCVVPGSLTCRVPGWVLSGVWGEGRRPVAFLRRGRFLFCITALAAPRQGAPPLPPARAPSPAHSPAWKQSRAAFALWLRWIFFVFFFPPSSRLPLAGSMAGRGREGRDIDPRLAKCSPSEPRAPFPGASMHRWRSFHNSQLFRRREGSRTPVWPRGGCRKCASYPPPAESRAAGQDWFSGRYPGSGSLFSNRVEASRGNWRTGLICNEFCPLALGSPPTQTSQPDARISNNIQMFEDPPARCD